jgi:hypothetical protein
MKTTAIPQVIKTQKGKKTVYISNGTILRTSTRDYKYALFGLIHSCFNHETRQWDEIPEGEWRLVGFGNNAQNLVNSWKSIFRCERFEVVTVQGETFPVKVHRTGEWGNPETVGEYPTLDAAREAADEYEKKLEGQAYKREFCKFDDLSGMRKGYQFTIF